LVGAFWWECWHIRPDPELFVEQFGMLRALGYGEGVNFKGELGRWVSFFWHGAYHRNMIWLVVIGVSVWKLRKNILTSALVGGLISFLLFIPHKPSTWQIIYLWPVMCILVVGWLTGEENDGNT